MKSACSSGLRRRFLASRKEGNWSVIDVFISIADKTMIHGRIQGRCKNGRFSEAAETADDIYT